MPYEDTPKIHPEARGFRVLDLFSGIGGFSLGLERAGMRTAAFCEIDAYCRKVLAKHWPDAPIHDDIRQLDGSQYAGTIDVVCGGFPCQDLSIAGYRKGIEGKRSGLWSELHRIIQQVRPRYAIVENVTNLLAGERGTWFGRVLGDLAEIGYDAEWHCVSASAIGAPHHRDRVWVITYPQCQQRIRPILRADHVAMAKERNSTQWRKNRLRFEMASVCREVLTERMVQSKTKRVDDGFPAWPHRLKACGNSVVPAIPELIGRAIIAYEQQLGMAA